MPEVAGQEWWQLCSVKRADVLEVAHAIQTLYSQHAPALYTDVKAVLAESTAALPSAAAALASNAAEGSLVNSPAMAGVSPAITLSSPTMATAAMNGGGSGGRSSSTVAPSPAPQVRGLCPHPAALLCKGPWHKVV